MIKLKTGICILLISLIALSSCEDKNESPKGKYSDGVFIANEGPFFSGTGTVSFYNRNDKTVTNDIFSLENSRPLGNIVQSIFVRNGKGYIVVNNAGKIEVVNSADFSSVGVIEGLELPRFYLEANDAKGYITQWGSNGIDGSVKVLDPKTLSVTKTIAVGKGPDYMLIQGQNLYVMNSGGFDADNRIAVINTVSETVTTHITVGDNPTGIVTDSNGKIWVITAGKKVYNSDFTINAAASTAGTLHRINPSTNTSELTLTFGSVTESPGELAISKSGSKLFYVYANKVYAMDITASSLSNSVLISRNFYQMEVDPETGNIYGADAGDFASSGKIFIYSEAGVKLDSAVVGIIPSDFFFD
jgi:YVTN family beta-propeller protein